jgi:hypothetical protein
MDYLYSVENPYFSLYTYSIDFNHSIDGHLSCFHFCLLQILLLCSFLYKSFAVFLLLIYLGVASLEHRVLPMFSSSTFFQFSKMLVWSYSPTSSVGELELYHIVIQTWMSSKLASSCKLCSLVNRFWGGDHHTGSLLGILTCGKEGAEAWCVSANASVKPIESQCFWTLA